MLSVGSGFAQLKTRTFVVTQDDPNEYGPYYFRKSSVESWLVDNKADITQIGDLLIISKDNFENTLDNLGTDGRFQSRKNLTDLNKQIVIGTPNNTRLVVLRLVQGYGLSTQAGDGIGGVYIVVENNAENLGDQGGRWMVRVARV